MNLPKFIILFLFLFGVYYTKAQQPERRITRSALIKCNSPFPGCFIGNWKGQLQWIIAGKPTQSFTMQLRIQPADSVGQYTWQIIYGDSGKDNRPYLLKPIDTVKGHWTIDELDGIRLDSYVHGNCFHGAFTVAGNTIVDNYCIENGKMRVEFFSIKLAGKIPSGKGTADNPLVDSYPIGSYQTGILTKLK